MSHLLEHRHIESVLQIPEVFPYHLFGQAFSANQESRDSLRTVLQKAASN